MLQVRRILLFVERTQRNIPAQEWLVLIVCHDLLEARYLCIRALIIAACFVPFSGRSRTKIALAFVLFLGLNKRPYHILESCASSLNLCRVKQPLDIAVWKRCRLLPRSFVEKYGSSAYDPAANWRSESTWIIPPSGMGQQSFDLCISISMVVVIRICSRK